MTKLLRILDGDTYDMQISLGFGLTATFRFRLVGVDTAEIYGKYAHSDGQVAKQFAEEWFEARKEQILRVQTRKSSNATVGIGDGAFGRWACDVMDETNRTLAQALREAGLDQNSPRDP